MPKENYQKIKLLKLVELLRQETDENHPMKTSEIIKRLLAMSITCDRRTLHKDMKMLNAHGHEVMSDHVDREMAYYISDRSFSVPELKCLIDAVQAASFITEKKTEELIDKIAELGGSHRAEILKSNIVRFNTRKHSNEAIYYNVERLEDAIHQNMKVIFLYFDLDEKGQRVYRRDKHHYIVEPVALVFNEDNYYLVAYSSKYDGLTNYRVDRMDGVEIVDEFICDKAVELRQSMSGYTGQAFKMYGGQPVQVTIQFSKKLIGSVYDRFGERTKIISVGEDKCTATVMVQLSPTFWGWVFQFGNMMRIISPDAVVEEYSNRVMELTGQK